MRRRLPQALALLFYAGITSLTAQPVPNRYIVELSTEPVAEFAARYGGKSALRSAAATSFRAQVQNEQETLRGQLTDPSVRVLGSVNTVANALIVDAPDPTALQNLPGVKRVMKVRQVHMHLDRSVVAHKIDQVWRQVGIGSAGRGMKIGIIDTGIDITHPGFTHSGLSTPDGFPKTNNASDQAYTNEKVIVARSYVYLLNRDPDQSARDHVGHGTALAMIAAGNSVVAPQATLQGIAPEAWLGNYKVFGTPGSNDSSSDAAILKALDDAVADGMDVVNLSLGDLVAPRLDQDPYTDAIGRATRAGVMVVVSSGNDGPSLGTMSSPGTILSAITVGAVGNDRTFGYQVAISGRNPVSAIPGDGPVPSGELTGNLVDISSQDSSGQACSGLTPGSLAGDVVLIRRGNCSFEAKINAAQQAGALAVLIYASQDAPDPIHMGVGQATLPAMMISWSDGDALKQALAASSLSATLRFTLTAIPVPGGLIADFSSSGPNVNLGIKPDLVAVGQNYYTATQTLDPNGDMYSADGYILVDGTSFSAPTVAGAAALLKAARPGLNVDQYRSLLINTATPLSDPLPPIQRTGAGSLNALAAVNATGALTPVSMTFGAGAPTQLFNYVFYLTSLNANAETWTIAVQNRNCPVSPTVDNSTVSVDAWATISIPVHFQFTDLRKGACEGTIELTGTSGTVLRLPWWFAAVGDPANLIAEDSTTSGRISRTILDAFIFKVTDAAGVPLGGANPSARVVSGDGTVVMVNNYDAEVPGTYSIDVRLGPKPGVNTFEVSAGGVTTQFSITGR